MEEKHLKVNFIFLNLENDNDNNNNNNFQNSQEFNSNMNPEDPHTCTMCGHFDPNYDEDALQMHWFRECPMVSNY